jgi:hypothetical protein
VSTTSSRTAPHRTSWVAALAVLLALVAVPALAPPPALASTGQTSRVFSDTCRGAPAHGFSDVPRSYAHSDAIACLRDKGITLGHTASTFQPGHDLTRGQLASFLVRTLEVAGIALPAATKDHFSDLEGSAHRDAVNRLANAGIVRGSVAFGVNAKADRAEMAVHTAAALRHAGVLKRTGQDYFFDDDGLAAEQAINDLAHAGVAAGRVPGAFAPTSLLRRDQMATFLARALDLIANGGSEPEGRPERPPVVRSSEGWLVAGGDGPRVGTAGTLTRYTVEVADGLESRQDVHAFRRSVESTLSDTEHGWTSRGGHRLQRVERAADARVRVVLAKPATVDRLCRQAGFDTAGIYSCWTGRIAAINADRWFTGVRHVSDLTLYRTYLINHEVGHALGHGHRSCPGDGRLAPVMMQLSKSTYGCVPNGVPYP